ncbi:MAG: methionyl-tRNA formyltransferase [Marinilabiliales bacterium]|nr:MAG: methionyl-tRNA formyltransferase [Marinilabiliales bacterium]
MKIVYMGTPAFAVPPLDVLHKSDHSVLACVTAPDRPAGRGRKLRSSDVKNYCLEHNIKILQPERLQNEAFINELKSLEADVFIVVAFRMLPEIIWRIPPKGTINLHASLLPEYRGAAPINWAIINGETRSGLTTFYINDKIDTGDILLQQEIIIDHDDNFGSLHDKMMFAGGDLLIRTIDNLDTIEGRTQDLSKGVSKPAPKLSRENTVIDWNNTAVEVHNHIKGLNPFPGAWTELRINGEPVQLKIFESEIADQNTESMPGAFRQINKNEVIVSCGSGSIKILKAQIQGKKAMTMAEILRGYGDSFSAGEFIL